MVLGLVPSITEEYLLGKHFSFLFKQFMYLLLVALGLHCCTEAFPSCSKLRLLLVAMLGLLIATASLVAECRLSSWGTQALVAARMWIFLDQGSNLCPLHWQADFYSLYHQGSPHFSFLSIQFLICKMR